MRQTQPPPDVELDAVIAVFLTEQLYPETFMRAMNPWRALIRKPTWRHAKQLMASHPERVSQIVERLVGERTGSHGPEELMCLGKVRYARGEYAAALEVFEVLVDRASLDRYKAFYNLGLCLVALGRTDEARHAFQRVALDLHPGDERATRALAELS